MTHGGPRPGAGRPATGQRPRIWARVDADTPGRIAALLDPGETLSEFVANAVRDEIERREATAPRRRKE